MTALVFLLCTYLLKVTYFVEFVNNQFSVLSPSHFQNSLNVACSMFIMMLQPSQSPWQSPLSSGEDKLHLILRWEKNISHEVWLVGVSMILSTVLKSVNLQYNTLGCLDDGTNEPSTKRLMFQVLFFYTLA